MSALDLGLKWEKLTGVLLWLPPFVSVFTIITTVGWLSLLTLL